MSGENENEDYSNEDYSNEGRNDSGDEQEVDPYELANSDNPYAQGNHAVDNNDQSFLDAALGSGVSPTLVDQLRAVWSGAGKTMDSVGAWARANPGLASMLTSGIGSAMKQKYSDEQLAKLREQKLADVADQRAYDKSLWERRNQSVIGTNAADLGIIGGSMFDKHVGYLQGRRT